MASSGILASCNWTKLRLFKRMSSSCVFCLPWFKFKEKFGKMFIREIIIYQYLFFLFSYECPQICVHSCLVLMILHALSLLSSEVSGRCADVCRSPAD